VRRWEMPSFKCKDIGMKDNFEVKTDNADELMPIIAMHAEKTHNMKEVDPVTLDKIKKAIKK
jgi:predicted small metal-binding protein